MTHSIDNFYDAWHFLHDHPEFFYKGRMSDHCEPGFVGNLYVMVMKVNPKTGSVDDDRWLNTAVEVWLECGGYADPTEDWQDGGEWGANGVPCHDPDLDCGGDTYEEAITNLARLVMDKYGDYPDYDICSHCLKNRPNTETPRDPDAEWFCSALCRDHGPYEWHGEPTGRGTSVYVRDTKCEHFEE